MGRHKVRIEIDGPYTGTVWVDDIEQEGLVEVSLDISVIRDIPCRVTLIKRIYPSELEIEGILDVTTLSSTAREYKFYPATERLGLK